MPLRPIFCSKARREISARESLLLWCRGQGGAVLFLLPYFSFFLLSLAFFCRLFFSLGRFLLLGHSVNLVLHTLNITLSGS